MNVLEKLVAVIDQAKGSSVCLNFEETLLVFEAVKHISKDKQLIDKVIRLACFSKNNVDTINNLSKREWEIFKLIGLGFSSREIADLLQISEATVSTHRKKIIKKLSLSGAGKLQKLSMQYIQSNFNN